MPRTGARAPPGPRPRRSSAPAGIPEALHRPLQAWLSERLKRDAPPQVSPVTSPFVARGLSFHQVQAALRHGIVLTRVHARRAHFAEGEWPEDLGSVIFRRSTLEKMTDDSWWR